METRRLKEKVGTTGVKYSIQAMGRARKTDRKGWQPLAKTVPAVKTARMTKEKVDNH